MDELTRKPESSSSDPPSPIAGRDSPAGASGSGPSADEDYGDRSLPPVALPAEVAVKLASEMRSLLRSRLHASATALFVGTLLFLIWLLLTRDFPQATSLRVIWSLYVFLIAMLGALAHALRRPLSMFKLRLAEIGIFGAIAAFILAIQCFEVLTSADYPIGAQIEAPWLILIYTYAIFIPNQWRRAALVVGTMAVAPIVLEAVLLNSNVGRARALSVLNLGDLALHMLFACVSSIYGRQTIQALRTQAFEARQFGNYRLLRRLGAGGMGEVFLAEHKLLKRPCVLKLIRSANAANPKALTRFEREVRATAALSHWNTVAIYDYGQTEDGAFYYVMEYLRGLSLEDLVDRHGPLPPGRAIHLLRQACAALREAHATGLIHRDIKPANLFVARVGVVDDVVKLLDFGLVKQIHTDETPADPAISREGAITGTPLYMSPEQAMGHVPVARSDLYSLGAVAYFLLTGQPPFPNLNAMELLVAHSRDPVTPPSQVQAGIPEDLERVVLRCLAKRPQDRFPDAHSLDKALAACACAGLWTEDRAAEWWRAHEAEGKEEAAAH